MVNLAIVVGLVAVLWLIVRFRLYWLPGVLLLGAGAIWCGQIPESHGEPAGLEGVARLFAGAIGFAGLVWIIVALGWTNRSRAVRPPAPPPTVELPPVIVVNSTDDVSKT